MKILVLYQDIDSGAKVATESLIQELQLMYRPSEIVTYVQNPQRFKGRFSFIKNTLWSMYDFYQQVKQEPAVDITYAAIYTAVIGSTLASHVPVVFHIHGDQGFKQKPFRLATGLADVYHAVIGKLVCRLQMYAYQSAAVVVFVSHAAKKSFIQHYSLPAVPQKTMIIPNGVADKYFSKSSLVKRKEMRKRLGAGTKKIVAYVGRIDEKKGIHLLLDACSLITPAVHLLIAYPKFTDDYSKAYLALLKSQAQRLSLATTFLASPADIRAVYEVADCVVLPSQQEMMPLVMLEALATGTPFLGTKVNGIHETLEKIDRSMLLESTEPVAMAAKIRQVLQMSKAQLKQYRTKSQRYTGQLTWKKSAQKLNRLLMTAIQL